MKRHEEIRIEGHVSADFEAAQDAFAENFSRRHELGGACCVYYRGEKIVDLWGGVRNKSTGEPWQENTMVLIWSATKGLAAMTLAVAHSRGWLDLANEQVQLAHIETRVAIVLPSQFEKGKSILVGGNATVGRFVQINEATLHYKHDQRRFW